MSQLDYRQQADVRSDAFVSNPDAIIVVSRQGIVLDANKQAEMVTGLAQRDLIGMELSTLVPRERRDGHGDLMAEFFRHPGRRVMGHNRDVAIVQQSDGGEQVIPVRIHLAASAIPNLGVVAVATIHQIQHHWSDST